MDFDAAVFAGASQDGVGDDGRPQAVRNRDADLAAGADGLLIEVHPRPAEALSDGPQSLPPEEFAALMEEIRRVAGAVGRTLA